MQFPILILKPGKEAPILNRHHWIFEGAVRTMPNEAADGSIVAVTDHAGKFLGHAYINRQTTIVARMLNFDKTSPQEAVTNHLRSAIKLRQELFDDSKTNTYRIVNGEGDNLPGLIVDRYNDVLSIQISTLGMEKLKQEIIDLLVSELNVRLVFEKSNLPSRKAEGLPQFQGIVYDEGAFQVEVVENGVKFLVDLEKSHKTGLYLDQREMRSLVETYTTGKKLLNCFSYTGGFSLYATRGGAEQTTSVDISKEVIEQVQDNFRLNGFDVSKHKFVAADVFKFLREQDLTEYDFVILDPPAFAKTKKDVTNAINGYRDINKQAMLKMKSGSYLLTCSCSYHVNEEMFLKMLHQAAKNSGKQIRIVGKHRLAADHPINLYHQEGDYLKSFLLQLV